MRKVAIVFTLAACLLPLAPSVTSADVVHLALRSASPAAGSTLSLAPNELRLTFTEPVEAGLAHLALVGPAGAISLASLTTAPDSANVLVGAIQGGLVAGAYTVSWRVVGADGHPVSGEHAFEIEPGALGISLAQEGAIQGRQAAGDPAPAGPAPPGEAAPSAEHHLAASEVTGVAFTAESPLYAAVRWLTFAGLIGVIGAVAYRIVLGRITSDSSGLGLRLQSMTEARAARLGLWMAAILVIAAALRFFAQSVALHGADSAFEPELVRTLLASTLWGWGWVLQVAGAVVAAIGFALVMRAAGSAPASGSAAESGSLGWSRGWRLAAIGAVALAITPGLSGHAAAAGGLAPSAILVDGAHVIGAGGWLGCLLVMLLVGVPAALRLQTSDRGPAVAALVNGFSPTALAFAGATVMTGLFAAWIHLGGLADLWESDYGRTLLVKLALVGAVFAAGAYNWLRVRPALGDEVAASHLRRSATTELAFGTLVLVVTAVLVSTPPPPPDQSAFGGGSTRISVQE